jgi:hypothetical protein
MTPIGVQLVHPYPETWTEEITSVQISIENPMRKTSCLFTKPSSVGVLYITPLQGISREVIFGKVPELHQ